MRSKNDYYHYTRDNQYSIDLSPYYLIKYSSSRSNSYSWAQGRGICKLVHSDLIVVNNEKRLQLFEKYSYQMHFLLAEVIYIGLFINKVNGK